MVNDVKTSEDIAKPAEAATTAAAGQAPADLDADKPIDWNKLSSNPKLSPEKQKFIREMGPAIERAIHKEGLKVPVEGVLGQLALESADKTGQWGQSSLATGSYNYAGLTAGSEWKGPVVAKADKQGEKAGNVTITQNFRRYDSVDAFAEDYVNFIQKPRYSIALQQRDPYHYALELGKAGYHNDNDAEYAGFVAKRASIINPDADDKFAAYGRAYKDVGDDERAKQINDSAKKYFDDAPTEQARKDRVKEHEAAIAQIGEKNPALANKLTAFLALLCFILGEPEKGNELLASVFGAGHVASEETYVKYDKETNGGLGGEQSAKQLANYNKDYQVKNAPEGWGKATPEAIAKAMAGEVIYQEQKGNGQMSYGTLTLTNAEGKVVSFPVISGGAGRGSLVGTANGSGAVDERYNVVAPTYEITNFRGNRTDKLANAMGGFSFDLHSNGSDYIKMPGEDRGEFRIHADGNRDGKTNGCLGCDPKDSPAMIAALRSHPDSTSLVLLPSLDSKNQLATHFKKDAETKVAVNEPAPEPIKAGAGTADDAPAKPKAPEKHQTSQVDKPKSGSDFASLVGDIKVPNMVDLPKATDETVSIEAAKKLTAGLELKTQKFDGWPPPPDASLAVAPDAAAVTAPTRTA